MAKHSPVVTLGQRLIYAPLGTVGAAPDTSDVPVLMSRPALYFPLLLRGMASVQKGEDLRAGAIVVERDVLITVLELGGGVAVPTAPGHSTFPIVWKDQVLSQFPPHASLYIYKSPELDALLRLSTPQRSR